MTENRKEIISPESLSSISREISLQVQNMQFCACNKQNAILEEENYSRHFKYSCIIRFLLLEKVYFSAISERLLFLNKLEHPSEELDRISSVVCALKNSFFLDFQKIINTDKDKFELSEMEFAKCLLSRCVFLCHETTYFHFLLVAAFLDTLVFNYVDDFECFRILYISEFCFNILYRRIFWKILETEEDFLKLVKFCIEFLEKFTLNSRLIEIENTVVRKRWVGRVKNCLNDMDVHFNFKKSEVELFEMLYSKRNHMKCKSEFSRKIENILYCDSEASEEERVCSFCCTKCHNYLEYAKLFISIEL